MKTAVIVHRWGPYHLARLQRAAEILPIVGIEVSSQSSEYAWDAVVHDGSVMERVTLFPNKESRQLSCSVVRRKVAECLDELGPRCVGIPGWSAPYALAALCWCTTNRVPAVLMGDSTASDWRRARAKEWQKNRITNGFSAALAAGTAARDYFCQLGMPLNRIFLGYNAVDNAYFQRGAESCRISERDLRTELGLERPFFLLVGRFIPEKNLFRTMDAYADYRRRMAEQPNNDGGESTPWDLVVLGDGQLRQELETHMRSIGLVFESSPVGAKAKQDGGRAVVHLCGFTQYNDLLRYYALAECLVLPSQKDTWGLVVNEAMASGLPVLVSSRCGCAPDLVEDARNGFLVDPFSVDDMAEKMLQMTLLPEAERKAMGERSREIIVEWGPERFAQGLKAAVEKALEVGPQKVPALDRLVIRALMARR